MTNPRGIQLRSLRLCGEKKIEARIDFTAGLNVISGVSDTGKSYILECIDFAFGSSDTPKSIEESKGYQKIYLECCDNNGKIFTLCRQISDGAIIKYESKIDDISSLNAEEFGRDGGAVGKLSPFLLKKCGLDEVDVVKNARGETQRFSFRTIAKWLCVDEEAIIGKLSPFLSPQYTEATSDTNGFNYLITGTVKQIAEVTEKPEITKAKIDAQQMLLDKLIAEIQTEIDKRSEEITSKIDYGVNITFDFTELKTKLEKQKQIISEAQLQLQKYFSEIREEKAEYAEIIVALERLKLLESSYAKDIERIDFILDGDHFYAQLKNSECPFCLRTGDITEQAVPSQHDLLAKSCSAERESIISKKDELSQTIKNLEDQGNEINSVILNSEEKIQYLEKRIEADLIPSLDELQKNIDDAMIAVRDSASKEELNKRRIKLIEQKVALNKSPKKSDAKISSGIDSLAMQDVCDCIMDVLKRWQFPNHGTVAFDSTTKVRDITIGGKKRSDFGKGYRAVSKAAFWVGVMEYCSKNDLPFPFFLILDSPLLNVKQHADKELVNDEVKQAFFDDMANLPLDCQVVVLENVEPRVIHFQVETTQGQTTKFALAKTRPRSQQVQHRAIHALETFDRWPGTGGFEHQHEFFHRQGPTIMATVGASVVQRKHGQRVAIETFVLYQPSRKTFERTQIMIA